MKVNAKSCCDQFTDAIFNKILMATGLKELYKGKNIELKIKSFDYQDGGEEYSFKETLIVKDWKYEWSRIEGVIQCLNDMPISILELAITSESGEVLCIVARVDLVTGNLEIPDVQDSDDYCDGLGIHLFTEDLENKYSDLLDINIVNNEN